MQRRIGHEIDRVIQEQEMRNRAKVVGALMHPDCPVVMTDSEAKELSVFVAHRMRVAGKIK